MRLARLARAAGLSHWVKLEVTPDPKWLLPDPIETLRAAEILVKEGFIVLPYIDADPVLAASRRGGLRDGDAARFADRFESRIENARRRSRIIISTGARSGRRRRGTRRASHAAEAMELGADAVLVNTAIAIARDPAAMARAFRLGVEAGRTAYRAGTAPNETRPKRRARSPVSWEARRDDRRDSRRVAVG